MLKSRTTTVEESVPDDDASETKVVLVKTYQFVWYILGLLEALLVFRFIFKATGASTASSFVRFIYAISSPFVAPFRGIYPVTSVEASRVEWVTLVAMLVYLLLAYGLVYLFNLMWPVDKKEV